MSNNTPDDLFANTPTSSGDYNASAIEVLEGLEPVRRRPGMYIGGTDDRAFHHLAALWQRLLAAAACFATYCGVLPNTV